MKVPPYARLFVEGIVVAVPASATSIKGGGQLLVVTVCDEEGYYVKVKAWRAQADIPWRVRSRVTLNFVQWRKTDVSLHVDQLSQVSFGEVLADSQMPYQCLPLEEDSDDSGAASSPAPASGKRAVLVLDREDAQPATPSRGTSRFPQRCLHAFPQRLQGCLASASIVEYLFSQNTIT